ncbi:MAG: Methyltransferase type 11 [Verrucomicrobiaceae bacterium]|nr:Methyltransferase type 11 [Verrucomicrobiaceae bacterium]
MIPSPSSGPQIESWTNQKPQQKHAELSHGPADAQSRNQGWWEAFPMTYQSWDKDQRLPATAGAFAEMDAVYFDSNPYLGEAVDFAAFRGQKVLEIGCGGGSAACRFAELGAEVTAVDITGNAIAICRQNALVKGVQVDARQMDAEKLGGLADASFDFIYSWGVLHHSSDPAAAYRQVARLLKPGGRWLIMVYHKNSLRYWGKGLFQLLGKGRLLRGETMESVQRFFTDGYYHKHYTADELAEALTQSGLGVELTAVTHMSSRMIPFIPEGLRKALKQRIGWLLVARGTKAG